MLIKMLSSMEKVRMTDADVTPVSRAVFSGARNETISWQVAYMCDATESGEFAVARVESPIRAAVRIRTVESVPVRLATYSDADDFYLSKEPGLYPDLLRDLRANCPTGHFRAYPHIWQTLWVDVEPEEAEKPGKYPVTIVIASYPSQKELGRVTAQVWIYPFALPRQRLIRTNWFHADCLADYYHVPVFSERHWEIMENFIRLAAKRGINAILTPALTPPLDTAVGAERRTVQLVGVGRDKTGWTFDFSLLRRWISMCTQCGIEYFEISHLFTQWGAKAAPKVVACVEGVFKRVFGWDTPADGPDYQGFLDAFLPALTAFLKKEGVAEKTFFHLSDEPSAKDMDNYLRAKESAGKWLKDFPVMDAMSDFEFYKTGAIKHPIVSNNHIEPFARAEVPNLWAYYCCGQYKQRVSNLFIAMPASRIRILGVQAYCYQLAGFLQWGYDFYYSMYSGHLIDPFFSTDGDGFVPAGDAFQVYPGEDGQPMESVRLMLLNMAMNDLRALQLLESAAGRPAVLAMIEEGLPEPITFSSYPSDSQYLIRLREKINEQLSQRETAAGRAEEAGLEKTAD